MHGNFRCSFPCSAKRGTPPRISTRCSPSSKTKFSNTIFTITRGRTFCANSGTMRDTAKACSARPKALRSLTLETLQKARDGLFTDAMHIFLAGGFSETELSLVKEAFESFSLSPFSPLPPVSAPPRYLKDVEKVGRGRDLQMMFTYHVKDVSEEEIFLSPYLKNAVFYGMDAVFNEFMTAEGFPFYSVDADYAVLGGELIFYWLVHVKKRT